MSKKHNNLLTIILFTLVSQTGYVYAIDNNAELSASSDSTAFSHDASDMPKAEPVKIQSVYLAKFVKDKTRVYDKSSDGRVMYQLAFGTSEDCLDPNFFVLGEDGKPYNNPKDQIKTYKPSYGNKLWKLDSGPITNITNRLKSYNVVFNPPSNRKCKVNSGYLPEVKISLSPATSDKDESRKLTITNICDKPIEITNIQAPQKKGAAAITTENQHILIPVGESRDIALTPGNLCSLDKEDLVNKEYKFTLDYAIDGQPSEDKLEIYIVYSCSKQAAIPKLEELKRERANRAAMIGSLSYLPIFKDAPNEYAYLVTQREDGSSIADLGHGLMKVTFATPLQISSSIIPSLDFSIGEKKGESINSTKLLSEDIDDYDLWMVNGEFPDASYTRNSIYSLNVIGLGPEGKQNEVHSGNLPDLTVELLANQKSEDSCEGNKNCSEESKCFNGENSCYKLKLTNNTDKDIKIRSIINDSLARTKFSIPFNVDKGQSKYIALSLPHSVSTSYTLPMNYWVIGENSDTHSYIRIITYKKSIVDLAKEYYKTTTLIIGGVAILAEEGIRHVINLRQNIEDERALEQNERHELELEGAQGITPQVLDVAFYVDKVNRLAIKARSAAYRAKVDADRAEKICPPPKALLAKAQSNQADRSATDAETAARIAQRGLDQFRNKQITYGVAFNLAKVIQFNKAKQAVRDAEAAANRAKAITDSCVGNHDGGSGGCMIPSVGGDGTMSAGFAGHETSIHLTGAESSGPSTSGSPPFGAGLGGHTESDINIEKQPTVIENDRDTTQPSSPTVEDYAEKTDSGESSQTPPLPNKNNDRYGLEKLQRELAYFGAWPQANNIFIYTSQLSDKGDFFPPTFEILGNQLSSFSGLPSKGTSAEPTTYLKYKTPTYVEYQKHQTLPQYMGHTKYQTQTYIEYPNYPTPPPYRIPSAPPKIFGHQR